MRRAASNTCVACELVCEDSIRTLNADAQLAAHTRAGALHLSQSDADALAEVGFFFSAAGAKALEPTTARLANSTAVVIKPHALAAGLAGKIIDAFLDEGFFVSAIESLAIDKIAAEEFFEVYKGVAPEYAGMIDTITAGPVIALEICGADAVEKVRAFVGPFDPEIARHIRPRTLRARFGVDKLRNAVHATDLPEDGVLEAEYLFQILKAAGPK